MKKYIILVSLLMSASSAFCQAESPLIFKYKNSLQFEAGGHAGLYSINYERVFLNKEKYKITGQAGASFAPYGQHGYIAVFPFALNGIRSFEKHHIELGAGTAFGQYLTSGVAGITKGPVERITIRAGYRYQKPDSRFLFRAAFTPLITKYAPNDISFAPWVGVAVGYAF